jgi:hypothetical protein
VHAMHAGGGRAPVGAWAPLHTREHREHREHLVSTQSTVSTVNF